MRYLLASMFLILMGCSHVQPINNQIPQKKIENHPDINAQGDTASISISRKESYFASSTYYWVSVNSIPVMALRSGDYTSFSIRPGTYQLAIDCFGDGAWRSKFVEISSQAGDSLFFEAIPAFSEYCDITAVEQGDFLKGYENPASIAFGAVPDPDR